MKNLSLEQLAEAMNGKLWEKNGKKRVYIQRGHNTQKMKTDCYLELDEFGIVRPNVFIECPSQPYSWISSEKEKIEDQIKDEIHRLNAEEKYVVVKKGNNVACDEDGNEVGIDNHMAEEWWYKGRAQRHIEKYLDKDEYEVMAIPVEA